MTPFQTAVSAVRERKKFTSQREAEEIVRAVILAIREPSEEMAMVDDPMSQWPSQRAFWPSQRKAMWTAMCDSLLGSGG